MLLSNLAEPEWIQISCTEKLLVDVICIKRTGKDNGTKRSNQLRGNEICTINAISKDMRCFLILWSQGQSMDIQCRLHNSLPVQLQNISYFQFLFDAMDSGFPPVLFQHQKDKTKICKLTFSKYFSVYNFTKSIIPKSTAEGFSLCTLNKISVPVGQTLFQCRSGVFISFLFVCDGIVDCPNEDKSDEAFCHCTFAKNISVQMDLVTSLQIIFIEEWKNIIKLFLCAGVTTWLMLH